MISLSKGVLSTVSSSHEKKILEVLETKKSVLSLCLKYYGLQSKASKQKFGQELDVLPGRENIKIKSVNFFLQADKRKTKTSPFVQRQIRSVAKPELFFETKSRKFANSPQIIQALQSEISHFDNALLKKILSGKPVDLLIQSEDYNNRLKKYTTKNPLNQVKRLISFFLDYDEFSKKNSIYTPAWGAYELTNELGIRSCLYCNRNYVLTVIQKTKIIRPELDHFFPKSIHPVLALSFYNLIPSCHICNSNLKGKVNFNLDDFFHPYLASFDEEGIKFTYKPLNPKAFFGDPRNIDIKIDRLNIRRLNNQIEGNIKLFKLDEVYNEHLDIVASLQLLQLKTNKKKITDIYNKILVDSTGKKYAMSEQEIYELAVRNHFSSDDFNKKPMAKFERDIAEEIGLIKKRK